MTFFRLILAFVPGSSSKKFKILLLANIATGIISLLLIGSGYAKIACYMSALLYGLSISVLYPLIFTLPSENGLIL